MAESKMNKLDTVKYDKSEEADHHMDEGDPEPFGHDQMKLAVKIVGSDKPDSKDEKTV
jgi:hypothetical protein